MNAPRIPFPRNGLISYHYGRNQDISLYDGFTLIADSGAYSAKTQGVQIKLPDLCAWANEWGDCFAWVAALDVIGDPVASYRNWVNHRGSLHGRLAAIQRCSGKTAMLPPFIRAPRYRRYGRGAASD